MLGPVACRWLIALALVVTVQSVAQNIRPLTEPADWIGAPALSPDGKTLAFEGTRADTASGILLRPLSGGQTAIFAAWDEKDGSPAYPAWSPDRKAIAFVRNSCSQCNSEVFVKGYPQGDERSLGDACRYPPSWTPDGHYLIAAVPAKSFDDCHIALITVNGSRRVSLTRNEGDIVAVSPDGKRLAYAAGNILKLVNLTADYQVVGTPVTLAREPHAISSFNWLRNGHELLYQVWSNGSKYTRLASAEHAPSAPRLVNIGGNIGVSQILSDGSALGTESLGQSALWRIDMQSATHEAEKVRSIPWTDQLLQVSPNGQFVAFATNRNGPTQIWIFRPDGSQPRVLVSSIPPFGTYGDQTTVDSLSWSPDGKWIALLTEPGVGHGVEDARLFLVSAAGGPPRILANCSQIRDPTLWSADSQSVFIGKDNEHYEASYFQVDIVSGKQTAIPKLPPSPRDLVPLPPGAEQPHLAESGHFIYFEQREPTRTRIVMIENFLARLGTRRLSQAKPAQ